MQEHSTLAGRSTDMPNQSPDIVLSRLKAIQEVEKLVPRLIAPWPAARRRCLRKGLLLHREGRIQIDLRGLYRFMSEPQGNHCTIGTCLEEVHGHGVSQAVNSDALLNQRGANVGGHQAMLGQQVLHAMDTETLTSRDLPNLALRIVSTVASRSTS